LSVMGWAYTTAVLTRPAHPTNRISWRLNVAACFEGDSCFLWYSICVAKAALLLTSLVQRSVHEYICLEYLSLAMGVRGIKVAIRWSHPPQMFTCDRDLHMKVF